MRRGVREPGRPGDVAKIEGLDGAMKGLLEVSEQQMASAIGMASHSSGAVLAHAEGPAILLTWA